MKFFQKIRMRLAHRRLARALDACTVDDLKRAAALHRWISSNNLMPGDVIQLTFDGASTDVVITDLKARYLKEREEIFKDLQQ